jgi:hypothetical protein
MTDAPITLTLDLWAQGHSASEIAEMLGHASHKAVTRIVEHAREIGDRRAVYHQTSLRLIGKGIPERDRFITPLQKTYRGVRIVALLSKAKPPKPKPVKQLFCLNGHARTPANIGVNRGCLACRRLARRAKEARS